MYELTIATDAVLRTTRHAGPADAHQALLAHAIDADLYLHAHHGDGVPTAATQRARAHVIGLLRLDSAEREPQSVGTATITAPADAELTPYPSATGAAAS